MVAWPTIRWLLEVDIGVAERSAGDHVPADPDREDSSSWAEFLVQHGLCHIWMEIPDVKGGHGITGSTGVHVGCSRKLANYSSQWWNKTFWRRWGFGYSRRVSSAPSGFTVNRVKLSLKQLNRRTYFGIKIVSYATVSAKLAIIGLALESDSTWGLAVLSYRSCDYSSFTNSLQKVVIFGFLYFNFFFVFFNVFIECVPSELRSTRTHTNS